jgi:hypothetical protein
MWHNSHRLAEVVRKRTGQLGAGPSVTGQMQTPRAFQAHTQRF